VKVLSICADYFMEAPLHSADSSDSNKSLKILVELMDASVDLGIGNVVIPCVDQSSIRDRADRERFCAALNRVIPKAALHKVNLSLETDLDPLDFSSLLNELDAECITVNYDTGNSASLGFDTTQELESYGDKITDLHIKDRVLNGGTVILGTGSWNYKSFFINLKKLNFKGPIILQAYRDDEGFQVFKKQLTWLREVMKQHYSISDRRVP
jgi:sugar phosphate isomerase/epimerase